MIVFPKQFCTIGQFCCLLSVVVVISLLEQVYAQGMPRLAPPLPATANSGTDGPVSKDTAVSQTPAPTSGSVMAPPLSALQHPWGTFTPGTSVRTQTTTLTFQGEKAFRNVTEKLVILESITTNGIELKQMVAIELGGKRFDANPQHKNYDFLQQPRIENQKLFALPPTQIQIGLQLIPCYVRRYESSNAEWKQQTTVWYSHLVYPYLLQSETIRSTVPTPEEPNGRILSRTTMNVVDTAALLGPRRSRTQQTYTTQTVRQNSETTTTTTASCSLTVPGGIVSATSRETDKNGKLIRQTDTVVVRSEALPSPANLGPVMEFDPYRRSSRRTRFYLNEPLFVEPFIMDER